MCESWKRKENLLADKWLVRDFQKIAKARKDYKSSLIVDNDLRKSIRKEYKDEIISKKTYLGVPVSILFGLIILAVAIGNRYFNTYLTDSAPNKTPTIPVMMLPTVVYVGVTFFIGYVYGQVSRKLMAMENCPDDATYEQSLG